MDRSKGTVAILATPKAMESVRAGVCYAHSSCEAGLPAEQAAMTLTLELPFDLEQRLATEATRLGLPLEQYALALLSRLPRLKESSKKGAELVAHWRREGVIGSRPDIEDSQVYTREMRARAERRTLSE